MREKDTLTTKHYKLTSLLKYRNAVWRHFLSCALSLKLYCCPLWTYKGSCNDSRLSTCVMLNFLLLLSKPDYMCARCFNSIWNFHILEVSVSPWSVSAICWRRKHHEDFDQTVCNIRECSTTISDSAVTQRSIKKVIGLNQDIEASSFNEIIFKQ